VGKFLAGQYEIHLYVRQVSGEIFTGRGIGKVAAVIKSLASYVTAMRTALNAAWKQSTEWKPHDRQLALHRGDCITFARGQFVPVWLACWCLVCALDISNHHWQTAAAKPSPLSGSS
jgi:hypothetical protein